MRIDLLRKKFSAIIFRAAFSVGILCVAAPWGLAQGTLQVVDVHVGPANVLLHPGAQARLEVHANVASGYHINSHKPTLDYLIPTKFELVPSDQFTLKEVAYPEGTMKKLSFFDTPISVYEGKIDLAAVLHAAGSVPPGSYTLKAKFAYQACSDHACLPPKSVLADVTVKVVP
jgi:hypothetical protein